MGFAVSLKTVQSVLESLKSGNMKPVPTPTLTPVPKVSGGATWYIPEIAGTVEGLKFYEGGNYGVGKENRQYLRFFDGADARYIYFEIELSYRFQYASQSFDIEFVYYRNGVSVGRATTKFSTFQGSTGSLHTDGWGLSTRGWFSPGDYVAELYSDGVLVVTGEFGIY